MVYADVRCYYFTGAWVHHGGSICVGYWRCLVRHQWVAHVALVVERVVGRHLGVYGVFESCFPESRLPVVHGLDEIWAQVFWHRLGYVIHYWLLRLNQFTPAIFLHVLVFGFQSPSYGHSAKLKVVVTGQPRQSIDEISNPVVGYAWCHRGLWQEKPARRYFPSRVRVLALHRTRESVGAKAEEVDVAWKRAYAFNLVVQFLRRADMQVVVTATKREQLVVAHYHVGDVDDVGSVVLCHDLESLVDGWHVGGEVSKVFGSVASVYHVRVDERHRVASLHESYHLAEHGVARIAKVLIVLALFTVCAFSDGDGDEYVPAED